MPSDRSPHADRIDTTKAKAADRAESAKEVWSEIEAQLKLRDEKTAQLKAARLAREAKGGGT